MTAIEKAAAAIANNLGVRRGVPIANVLEILTPKLRDEVTEDAKAVLEAIGHEDLLKALVAAGHALRSYQHGNGSPHLAESVAQRVEAIVAAAQGK